MESSPPFMKSSPQAEAGDEDIRPQSDDTTEPDKGIIVFYSLGRLIQVYLRLLSQEEYKVFSRKISKYLITVW